MNKIDLLILHGPPGAGKSSIANALAAHLRKHEIRNTVIELDDLAKIYPLPLLDIMYKNLAAIWPNYMALGDIKVIIPTYLQKGELEIVAKAAPAKRLTVCEIVISRSELRKRVATREPDMTTRKRLFDYIDRYADNRTEDESVDLKISSTNRSPEDTAHEIIMKLGWPA